jgi:hypothetical protein
LLEIERAGFGDLWGWVQNFTIRWRGRMGDEETVEIGFGEIRGGDGRSPCLLFKTCLQNLKQSRISMLGLPQKIKRKEKRTT